MPSSGVQTTTPSRDHTYGSGEQVQVPALAFVRAWSATGPEHVGETGFLSPFKWIALGRGGDALRFAPHRPGEPHEGGAYLDGTGVSRVQGWMRASAVGVDLVNVGECPTLVNGVKLPRFEGDPAVAVKNGVFARLVPGDRIYLRGEELLVCVSRQRQLPFHPAWGALHAFGGVDADRQIGESEAMWQLRRELTLAALLGRHVLLLGETGTGKTLAAEAIRRMSSRASGPWIVAAGFPPELAYVNLFGNLPNFPNPGTAVNKGFFASAHGGVLFLDEIGDLPEKVQAALLHALDKKGEYIVLGESTARVASVLAVGATSRDTSHLRADLYHRLEKIRMPPLRERPEDIALLARHLLLDLVEGEHKVAGIERLFRTRRDGRLEPNLSGTFVDALLGMPFPGNTRELQSILIKAVNASPENVIRAPAARSAPASWTPQGGEGGPPAAPPSSGKGGPPPTREVLLAALAQAEWNSTRAGRVLGMHRNAIDRLKAKYGLHKPRADEDVE